MHSFIHIHSKELSILYTWKVFSKYGLPICSTAFTDIYVTTNDTTGLDACVHTTVTGPIPSFSMHNWGGGGGMYPSHLLLESSHWERFYGTLN